MVIRLRRSDTPMKPSRRALMTNEPMHTTLLRWLSMATSASRVDDVPACNPAFAYAAKIAGHEIAGQRLQDPMPCYIISLLLLDSPFPKWPIESRVTQKRVFS